MIDAVVFDFDGLMLDTESVMFTTWVEVYAEYGCDLSMDDWAAHIGTLDGFDPYATLVSRAVGPVPPEAHVRATKRPRHDELLAAAPLMPGVQAWIDEALDAGLAIAIASSSPADWVTPLVERELLLPHFSVIACADGARPPKPAPDVYLAACDELGVEPSRALAVEDSAHGVTSAKAAGLWCVAVPSPLTRTLDFSSADVVLASLADATLADVIDRIPGNVAR